MGDPERFLTLRGSCVASLMLTTEVMITDMPEKKGAGGGMPGGMGGMGGGMY